MSQSIGLFLSTYYNSGAAAVCCTLQLKRKSKFPYYYSTRIWKITLDVSHSPGELLSCHIFVLSPAQELKKDFSLDWKPGVSKSDDISWQNHNNFIVSTCILLPNPSHHRYFNRIDYWGNLRYLGVLNNTFFPITAQKPAGNLSA